MCASAGLQPEIRTTALGYDVFIAHGYSARPGRDFARFGIEHEAYPLGAYVVLWCVAEGEDRVKIAGVIPYINVLDKDDKIKEAVNSAASFIADLKRVKSQGPTPHALAS